MFDSNIIKAHPPPPPPDHLDHRQHSYLSTKDALNAPSSSPLPLNSNVPRYLPRHSDLPPPPPPLQSNDPPRHFHPRLLPPPPSFPRSNHDTPRAREAMYPALPPPPPPPPPRSRFSVDSDDRAHHEKYPRQPQGRHPRPQGPFTLVKVPSPPSVSTSDGTSHHSRRRRRRGRPRPRSSNESSSSTYSRTRPSVTQESASSSSSGEDPILYRNARQFPPLLPTAQAFGSPGTDSKASMTKHITSWVARYERTRSPLSQPPVETKSRIPHGGLFSSLNDGATLSDASSESSEGEIEMLWTQLKEKRDKLNRMKAEMAKRRKELRDLRRRKDDADNAFMSVIRPMLISQRGALHTPPNLLDRRLNEMQSLRTEYHFLEANYEGLEVMLDEEEAELNSLETRFFSLLAAGRTRLVRPQAESHSELEQSDYFQSMPVDLKGISPDGPPEDLHPLYVELMSTVGDLGNAKEDYDDLLFLKEQYDYDLEMKRTTGKGDVDEEVTEFYTEFPEEQKRMTGNVKRLEAEVGRLKHICEVQGVMRRHMSSRVEYLLYPEREYEDVDLEETDVIRERRPNLAHHKFPVLLSQPEHIMVPQTALEALKAAAMLSEDNPDKRAKMQLASKEYAIDRLITDRETDSKAEFVDRWLLQQLRMSPMNAALLHSTFISSRSLKIKDFWRWQSDVLHYWWRDGTAALAENSFKMVASEDSRNASRIGTPQLSRAASDGIGAYRSRHFHVTSSSEAHTATA
ncbi:hypothetical protein EDB81DRAFT_649013 [Dactylonectria macrodidyma]|uniref:Uncharacterized protein n=1 Tax=Dactylonectria macrodidyma TaxID=307937 RepID=A0A9P9JAX6_9HYPO|nr:hypothetical protein EDB81DRAFT_649013 [Dactylonectria macrodidyma]